MEVGKQQQLNSFWEWEELGGWGMLPSCPPDWRYPGWGTSREHCPTAASSLPGDQEGLGRAVSYCSVAISQNKVFKIEESRKLSFQEHKKVPLSPMGCAGKSLNQHMKQGMGETLSEEWAGDIVLLVLCLPETRREGDSGQCFLHLSQTRVTGLGKMWGVFSHSSIPHFHSPPGNCPWDGRNPIWGMGWKSFWERERTGIQSAAAHSPLPRIFSKDQDDPYVGKRYDAGESGQLQTECLYASSPKKISSNGNFPEVSTTRSEYLVHILCSLGTEESC